ALDSREASEGLRLCLDGAAPQDLFNAGGRRIGHAEPVMRAGIAVGVLACGWVRPARRHPPRLEVAARLFAAQASVALERAERISADRERRALQINDAIVQGLVVAKYAVQGGHLSDASRALDETLRRARELISDQLDEVARGRGGTLRAGDLVRDEPGL